MTDGGGIRQSFGRGDLGGVEGVGQDPQQQEQEGDLMGPRGIGWWIGHFSKDFRSRSERIWPEVNPQSILVGSRPQQISQAWLLAQPEELPVKQTPPKTTVDHR